MVGCAVVLTLLSILGGCFLFATRHRESDKVQDEILPEDRLSLMEESALGIHKLDFAEWQVTNIPNNGNDVITVKLIDSVDKKEISKKLVTTNNRDGKLSVAAIERGIQEAQKELASKEVAKRNRAAAISTLVHKYNGKSAS